jgi:hypothetical protein
MSDPGSSTDQIRADIARLSDELARRLDEHEGTAGADEWTRRARLLRLEAAWLLSSYAPPPKPSGRGWRDTLKGFGDFLLKAAPVATSVWVAMVAYFVNDKVENAMEVRRVEIAEGQLDLATIQAIEAKLDALRTPDLGEEEAEKLAMQIAAFGSRAMVPLVMELDLDRRVEEKRARALGHALRMMALVSYQRERLCDILDKALEIGANGNLFRHDGKAMMSELSLEIACQRGAASAAAPRG